MVLSLFFLIYEFLIISHVNTKRKWELSAWADAIGLITFLVWANMLIVGHSKSDRYMKYLLTIAEYLIVVNGIIHSKAFSKIRNYIRLIKKVFWDMKEFLMLVGLFTILYGVVFLVLTDPEDSDSQGGIKAALDLSIQLVCMNTEP